MNVSPYTKAIETENQILNLALYQKNACSLLHEIDVEEFIEPKNKGIKKIIDKMFSEHKEISTTAVYNEIVGDELRKHLAMLACEQYMGDPDTIFSQFQSLHRLIRLQPIIEKVNNFAQIGHPGFEEAFEEMEEAYVSSRVVQESILMKDIMKKNPEKIREEYVRYKIFGIPSLQEKLRFLYGGQYITIAAAPGEGKSTMANIIAEAIPDSLIMSYEMTAEELHDVMVSRHAKIDSELIESGELDWMQKRTVESVRRELSEKCTLLVNDVPLNMSDMFAFMKRQVMKHHVKCIVIDYAQIVPGLPGKGTQVEKFELLSRRFKLFARSTKTIVIALSQLNKDSLKDKRMPTLSDLRGSLSFGADADKVIFLFDGDCSIGKNRKGKVGSVDGFRYDKAIHTMY